MKIFKYAFIVLTLIFIVGCNCPVDWSKDQRVVNKETNKNDISIYYMVYDSIKNDTNLINSTFCAPYDFAKLGDVIGYRDNVIRVIHVEEQEDPNWYKNKILSWVPLQIIKATKKKN